MANVSTTNETPRRPWTRKAAAEFLGVSLSHLEKLIKAGEVKVIKIGAKKTLLTHDEVCRLANRGI